MRRTLLIALGALVILLALSGCCRKSTEPEIRPIWPGYGQGGWIDPPDPPIPPEYIEPYPDSTSAES